MPGPSGPGIFMYLSSDPRACGIEFGQALHGSRAKAGSILRDRCFTGQFQIREPPVERRNQFLEFPRQLARTYLHGRFPLRLESRRETFQISPQLPHRQ